MPSTSPEVDGTCGGACHQTTFGEEVRPASNLVGGAPDNPAYGTFTVFAAMPFNPLYEDVFHVAIKAGVQQVGGRAVRVDRLMHGGDAVQETLRQIGTCRAVVADLSTGEPDVFFEVGFAQALGKPILRLCSTAYTELPFMVRNQETLSYTLGRTHRLAARIAVYLEQLLRPEVAP